MPATVGGVSTGFAFTFLMLRAFSGGCVAMTGTEAISNGVGAFKAPASRNAAMTLTWMATILGVFFLGNSFLAQHLHVQPSTTETVLSQLGHSVFGTGFMYYALQYSTFAVLVLAANTSFADFPRLGSILANQRYLPRQLSARGDRLAFSNGIVALALVAMLLVWIFHGDTTALIPLYAIGVFLCFTLSQAGMVRRWIRTRPKAGTGKRPSTALEQPPPAWSPSSRSGPSSRTAPGSSSSSSRCSSSCCARSRDTMFASRRRSSSTARPK